MLTTLLAVLPQVGCRKPPAPERITCFDARVAQNSEQTRQVFSARRCQGGGVTWAALLDVLARRRGSVSPLDAPAPGWTGAVYTLNGQTRFSIDEEGDGARFCAGTAELSASIRRDYQRLNEDPAELRRAMSEASALAMECLEEDGSVPELPGPLPMPSEF